MSQTETKRYHHGDLRNALLRAGMEIIERDGLARLSLRALAAAVGVSHTAPKNHFGSMKGLVTAIGAQGFRKFAAEMRNGLTQASTRKERLHAATLGYVRFAQGHPELFKIMFSPDHCDREDTAFKDAAQESYRVLIEISEGLAWDKSEAPNAQKRTEIMLWSFVHGYATLLNAGRIDDRADGAPPPGILDIMPDFGYLDR
ncbi:MAG: TetR/AcrR family transcriptional regulator [Pseudomonadota bacterium]